MSVAGFLGYEAYIRLQDKQLEIYGQPCTVYTAESKVALGYENTEVSDIKAMNTDMVLAAKYRKRNSRIWINFTVTKAVFYKFNWFPDDADELCMAMMDSDSECREGDYIRSATTEATSIWGDMIFEVRKIQDIGLAQVLKRVYFLKPTNNKDLAAELAF